MSTKGKYIVFKITEEKKRLRISVTSDGFCVTVWLFERLKADTDFEFFFLGLIIVLMPSQVFFHVISVSLKERLIVELLTKTSQA